MLFVAQRGVLGHVNLDFTDSDKPVFILPNLSGGLDLEHVFLQIGRHECNCSKKGLVLCGMLCVMLCGCDMLSWFALRYAL